MAAEGDERAADQAGVGGTADCVRAVLAGGGGEAAFEAGQQAGDLGAGFVAGILGGLYGMNGPPLVIYGAMQALVAAAFSGDAAGVFSAGELADDDRLPVRGILESGGDVSVCPVVAADPRGDAAWPGDQQAAGGGEIFQAAVRGADGDRRAAGGAVGLIGSLTLRVLRW